MNNEEKKKIDNQSIDPAAISRKALKEDAKNLHQKRLGSPLKKHPQSGRERFKEIMGTQN
jgi:hypothetical protein